MPGDERRVERDGLDALFGWGRSLVAASTEVPREALRFLAAPVRTARRAPPPGAQPGHLVLPAEAPPPTLRLIRYDSQTVEDRSLDGPAGVGELLRTSPRVAWLDVQGFGDRRVLEQIAQELDIHPLALADIVHVPQRPKAELYGDRLLLVTHVARLEEAGEVEVEQVSIVLGPGWVATFQELPGDVFDSTRTRIISTGTRIRELGADYLAYSLLDAVVDGYFPVIDALAGVADALEEEVIERPSRATLARIHAMRRTLSALHRTQWQQRDAISALLRGEEFPFTTPVRVFLRDVHDHAFQAVDAMESFRDLAVGLMELYLSSASHRMNEVMKTLTIVATIFIPLTFLSGVYGMNFERMPELGWAWGYPAAWSVMLTVALACLYWFRSKGWIGESPETGEADETGSRTP